MWSITFDKIATVDNSENARVFASGVAFRAGVSYRGCGVVYLRKLRQSFSPTVSTMLTLYGVIGIRSKPRTRKRARLQVQGKALLWQSVCP